MATATLIENDGNYQPRLVRTPKGYEGQRHYQISGAADMEECLAAAGLPAQGDAWSVGAVGSKLYASDYEVVMEGGPWFAVRVTYKQDRGGTIVPSEGKVLTTTIRSVSTSETVYYDVTGEYRLGEDGAQKFLTAIEIHVDQYVTPSGFVAMFPSLLALSNEPKLNKDAIVLPNVFDSGQYIEIPERMALYVNFEPEPEGGLVRVRHILFIRELWDWTGVEIGYDMVPIASYTPQPVYEDADFIAAFDPPDD